MNRGILTERDREVLLEEAESLKNPSQRRNEIRYSLRQRRDNLFRDLEVLREAGEEEILESLLAGICDDRLSELREQLNHVEAELSIIEEDQRRIEELRAQMDDIWRQLKAIEGS